ncbi:hypothetical protein C0J52_14651, partial [Blattella germanica]
KSDGSGSHPQRKVWPVVQEAQAIKLTYCLIWFVFSYFYTVDSQFGSQTFTYEARGIREKNVCYFFLWRYVPSKTREPVLQLKAIPFYPVFVFPRSVKRTLNRIKYDCLFVSEYCRIAGKLKKNDNDGVSHMSCLGNVKFTGGFQQLESVKQSQHLTGIISVVVSIFLEVSNEGFSVNNDVTPIHYMIVISHILVETNSRAVLEVPPTIEYVNRLSQKLHNIDTDCEMRRGWIMRGGRLTLSIRI